MGSFDFQGFLRSMYSRRLGEGTTAAYSRYTQVAEGDPNNKLPISQRAIARCAIIVACGERFARPLGKLIAVAAFAACG
jgi:hypothetical protein